MIGCSIGDFGTIGFFQYFNIDFPVLYIMMLAILNGLITSIILETIILLKDMSFNSAIKTALGMSLTSMVSMEIAMNTVVTMTYEIKDADGSILELSKEPVAYLHGGYDNIFPKVEEAMHGKKVGDTIELGLEPSDAFGEYDAELVQIEPKSAFPEAELKIGMQFEGDDSSGEVIVYSVTDITDDKVVVMIG